MTTHKMQHRKVGANETYQLNHENIITQRAKFSHDNESTTTFLNDIWIKANGMSWINILPAVSYQDVQ